MVVVEIQKLRSCAPCHGGVYSLRTPACQPVRFPINVLRRRRRVGGWGMHESPNDRITDPIDEMVHCRHGDIAASLGG
jgi:hypothetical protein